jgi:D-sedoheptulose 7-phosphate isomerase
MENIRDYIAQLQEILQQLPLEPVRDVVSVLHYARLSDRQVFIMGNGGSAATASHFACDLSKGTLMPGRPRFRVMALTDSMPLFSAYANDYGYDCVFAEQLASFVRTGDVVIGISGSGNSPNVIKAIELAKETRATTIGLTGFDGGRLCHLVDICILVSGHCMEQVEDIHLMLEHIICTCLRKAITADPYPLPEIFVPELWGLRLVERLPAPVAQAQVDHKGDGQLEAGRLLEGEESA